MLGAYLLKLIYLSIYLLKKAQLEKESDIDSDCFKIYLLPLQMLMTG